MVVETRRGVSVNPGQQTGGVGFSEIFAGQEDRVSRLTQEEREYLLFVIEARKAIVAGDDANVTLFSTAKKQELGADRVFQLAGSLKPLISSIHKAIPSSTSQLIRIEESHGEVRVGEAGNNDEIGELHDPPADLG